MKKEKLTNQLGMNPSTARGRLIKDIMWKLICLTNQNVCFHCNEPMTRETYSIEHKIPWLDSDDPYSLFFDLTNISFSHLVCNISAARKPTKLNLSEEDRAKKHNEHCRTSWNRLTKEEKQDLRKLKYLKYGV